MSTPSAPVTLSPENTIAGLSVETFSFVFLGIGLTAPVVFLLAVFITMKCYSNRRFKRYKKYEERLRITREIWDMERRQYFHNWKGSHGVEDIDFFKCPPEGWDQFYMQHYAGALLSARKQRKPLYMDGVMYSNSNPDVFFKETPALLMEQKARRGHVRAASSPGEITAIGYTKVDTANVTHLKAVEAEANRNFNSNGNIPADARSQTQSEINSEEEAKALESFDQIYQDMDLDSSTLNTNSEYDPSSLLRVSGNPNTSVSYTSTHNYETIKRAGAVDKGEKSSAIAADTSIHSKGHRVQTIKADLHHPGVQSTSHSGAMSGHCYSDDSAINKHPRDLPVKLQKQSMAKSKDYLAGDNKNSHGSIGVNDLSIVTTIRPHSLPLVNREVDNMSTALVTTVTPTHLALSSPVIGSNGLSYTSPTKDKLLVNNGDSLSVAYVNSAYQNQDSPTEYVTKL